ncbi:MAG TPA: nucleotidyltransferase domain-containing protein [Caulobacterales bacterium]|nr:nucleotidyltransferase domain-containing protein [Caulobacterales bacterium]
MDLDFSPAIAVLKREIPGLAGVYLFGSFASGAARPDSDVDLAFYAGRPASRALVLDVMTKVAAALSRDVDLVDLASASTILQMQVLRDGRLVAAPDPRAIGFFELRVLRDYQDLKRRRSDIEADIVRRGRVHG